MLGRKLCITSELVEIESGVFWQFAKKNYPIEQNWHLLDNRIQKITKNLLGLEFIQAIFSNHNYFECTVFQFKIINKKKYLWAKIKHGV